MTGDTLSAAALCIVGAVTAVVLRQYCREQALFSSIAVCVILGGCLFAFISPVIKEIEVLFERTTLDRSYFSLMIKAVGICYITGIAGDICRDCGENALATAAEIWGRIALLVLTLPMIESLLSVITGVLN